jgi:hypothetical protein
VAKVWQIWNVKAKPILLIKREREAHNNHHNHKNTNLIIMDMQTMAVLIMAFIKKKLYCSRYCQHHEVFSTIFI